jgi:hypothetical protein
MNGPRRPAQRPSDYFEYKNDCDLTERIQAAYDQIMRDKASEIGMLRSRVAELESTLTLGPAASDSGRTRFDRQ